ncbi:hypothetical protein ACFOW4_13530 [Micromonospora sp. GCM10011542]|uniref:hypothetical protein n=1 Tax=Micromonospora sp. GCM10011542 TaxID=3317337 RepID=UPI003616053B
MQVEPTVVAEIDADFAFEHGGGGTGCGTRGPGRTCRCTTCRLLLGEEEGYFGEP